MKKKIYIFCDRDNNDWKSCSLYVWIKSSQNEQKFSYFRKTSSRVLKENLSWSSTWAKFYQLSASISVVLPQLNLTKLKLEYLKFGF